MVKLKNRTLPLLLIVAVLLSVFAFMPQRVFAVPTRVQGNARGVWSSGTSVAVTMASTPTSGNLEIMTFGATNCATVGFPTQISSISQTGVTWTSQVVKLFIGTNACGTSNKNINVDSEIWAGVVSSGASTSITITLTVAPSSGTGWNAHTAIADICEYSNMLTASFLDKTATNSGTTSPTDSGTTAATTVAAEVWVASIFAVSTSTAPTQSAPTNSFTLLDGGNDALLSSEGYLEKIVAATNTANTGTTVSPVDRWAGAIATFKGTSNDFSLSNTGDKSVPQTGSVTNTITVTNVAGNPKTTLSCVSGLPSGASCGFGTNPVTPTGTSVLTITTSSSPKGTYLITVQGTNTTYGLTHTTTFNLLVTGLTISISSGINITAGYSGTAKVTVLVYSSITTGLSCQSGLPSGATCNFGPTSALGNFTSTLTISTSPTLLFGTYSITVLANSSSTTATALVALKILGFSLSNVNNVVVYSGSYVTQNNWLTVSSTNIGSPAATITGVFIGAPIGMSFSAIGPSSIPGTIVYNITVTTTSAVDAGNYPIGLTISGANQSATVGMLVLVFQTTITNTVITTTSITSIVQTSVSATSITSTISVSTRSIGLGIQTHTLYNFTPSDIPLVLYGIALFLVLAPTMLVLVRSRSIAALLIAMTSGIIWAVVIGVIPITALLLLIGVAALAILFRSRR